MSGEREFPACEDCGGAGWQANPGPTGEPDMRTVRPCWRCQDTGNALMPLRDGEVGERVPYGTSLTEFIIAIRSDSDWASADAIWNGLGGCLVRPAAASEDPQPSTSAPTPVDWENTGARTHGSYWFWSGDFYVYDAQARPTEDGWRVWARDGDTGTTVPPQGLDRTFTGEDPEREAWEFVVACQVATWKRGEK